MGSNVKTVFGTVIAKINFGCDRLIVLGKITKAMITKIIEKLRTFSHRYPLTSFVYALSPNQIWLVSNKMVIKRFDKLLEAFVWAH